MNLILAFGDSLTYGYGVEDEFSYPRLIEKKTGLKVINAGVDGEHTFEGLERLSLFLEETPDLVILCHGANDMYDRRSIEEIKANVLAMVKLIQKETSNILLVGVPNFRILSNDIHSLYNEIASETGVLLEENLLRNILTNNFTRTDYIHPNIEGYEIMADSFIETLNLGSQEAI